MSFMATEIAETGAAIRRQLDANAGAVADLAAELRAGEPSFVATIARGSSDHAALFLKHVIELKLGLACASLGPSIASLYHASLRLDRAVAITISQSGRSPDIVAMQRRRSRRARRRSPSSMTPRRRPPATRTRLFPCTPAKSGRWRRPSR